MSDLTGPIDEVDEGDLAEQRRSVDEGPTPSPLSVTPDEADEADALDQSIEVSEDDEDYPRGG